MPIKPFNPFLQNSLTTFPVYLNNYKVIFRFAFSFQLLTRYIFRNVFISFSVQAIKVVYSSTTFLKKFCRHVLCSYILIPSLFLKSNRGRLTCVLNSFFQRTFRFGSPPVSCPASCCSDVCSLCVIASLFSQCLFYLSDWVDFNEVLTTNL